MGTGIGATTGGVVDVLVAVATGITVSEAIVAGRVYWTSHFGRTSQLLLLLLESPSASVTVCGAKRVRTGIASGAVLLIGRVEDERAGEGQHPMKGTSAGQKGSLNSMVIFSYVPMLRRDIADLVSWYSIPTSNAEVSTVWGGRKEEGGWVASVRRWRGEKSRATMKDWYPILFFVWKTVITGTSTVVCATARIGTKKYQIYCYFHKKSQKRCK